MNASPAAAALLVFAVLATAASATHAEWSLLEGAQAHPDYRGGVPKKGDVVFSTRFKNPDAIAVAKSFKATRIEWVYTTDPEFTADLKREFGWFGGALNSTARMPNDVGRAKDFDGNPVINPRMKAFNTPWNTATHPETLKTMQALAKANLAMGADSMQFDDPLFQLYSAQLWGGDFNPSTLAGFSKFLETYPDKAALKRLGLADFVGDYREFLTRTFTIKDAKDYAKRQASLPTTPIWHAYLQETVVNYFVGMRKLMNQTRGSAVPVSMNLGFLNRPAEANRHFFLAGLADYAMPETPIASLPELELRALTIRSLALGYVPSIQPKETADNRVAIATLYALGGNPIVPWDIYVGNDSAGKAMRMFGKPEEFGDLYGFVRHAPGLFNDREHAAVVGILAPVDRYDDPATMAVVAKLTQRRIPFTFVAVGGTQIKLPVNASHADRLKLLVAVNPDTDFAPADLEALRSMKVQRVGSAQLTDALLDSVSPFVVVGDASGLKLYPRARIQPGIRDQLVVHLVDGARGADSLPKPGCVRRLGLRTNLLGGRDVEEMNWYVGKKKTELELTRNPREVLVTVPECVLWGVLAVTLKK